MAGPFDQRPGLNNANAYLAAGTPYMTGSTLLSGSFSTNNGQIKVPFRNIAKSVTVVNKSSIPIRVHFADLTTGNVINGHHYLTLTDNKDSATFNVRVKEIYISLASASGNGTYELFAELTAIPSSDAYTMTGSGLTD